MNHVNYALSPDNKDPLKKKHDVGDQAASHFLTPASVEVQVPLPKQR